MTDRSSITVEGEPVEALIGVLMCFEHDESARDGMIHVHAEYSRDIGDPFERALMRIEAEFLLADAAALGSADYVERTDDQRRCDALIELAKRVNRALRAN